MRPDKVATLRFALILAGLIIGLLYIIYMAGSEGGDSPSVEPIPESVITRYYPDLYKAIFTREFEELNPFLDHESDSVRFQAWRALANTPLDSAMIGRIIDMAEQQASDNVAWFAISQHTLGNEQLRRLEKLWEEKPESRAGICRVLGQQGDRGSLQFLESRLDAAFEADYEYHFALAMGRLMQRYKVENDFMSSMVNQAFQSDDFNITRAYLYGLYRNNIQDLRGSVKDTLYSAWRFYNMGVYNEVDQYMARILGERVFRDLTLFYNSENLLEANVQVAIELAQLLGDMRPDSTTLLPARILLSHSNPHVVSLTLQSLKGKLSKDQLLYSYIHDYILDNQRTDPFVRVQALITLGSVDSSLVDDSKSNLDQIGRDHPYLVPFILQAKQINVSGEAYLNEIESIVSEKDPLQVLYAIRALNSFWQSVQDKKESERHIESIRSIVYTSLSLNDRGVAFALQGLLRDENLFNADDFMRIRNALQS